MRVISSMKCLGLLLVPVLVAGCASGTYQTNTDSGHLIAYAAKSGFPYDSKSDVAKHLFATVGSDGTITIYNAGDESYPAFELWVNKQYTVHVSDKKLETRSSVILSFKDIYNNSATSLDGQPAGSITDVEMYIPSPNNPADSKLLVIQGPILPH